jgi:hypothetical protein
MIVAISELKVPSPEVKDANDSLNLTVNDNNGDGKYVLPALLNCRHDEDDNDDDDDISNLRVVALPTEADVNGQLRKIVKVKHYNLKFIAEHLIDNNNSNGDDGADLKKNNGEDSNYDSDDDDDNNNDDDGSNHSSSEDVIVDEEDACSTMCLIDIAKVIAITIII